jgi:hypothetical protein
VLAVEQGTVSKNYVRIPSPCDCRQAVWSRDLGDNLDSRRLLDEQAEC